MTGAPAARSEVSRPAVLEAAARPRVAVPLLFLLGTALFIVNLGGYPFYTKGEPREAVTVLDMVRGGGVILPLRAGVEIPSKPPLMHWTAALISLAAGRVNEWTVRMPSAIFAIAAILACYLYGRALFGDSAGLLAGAVLGTSFQILQAGSGARVDMTLTFFIEIVLFEFMMVAQGIRRRRGFIYLAAALAVLAKGPVGIVLPGIVAFVWIAFEGRWNLAPKLGLLWGVPLVIAIDGGWYLAAAITRGGAFIHKQILAENLFRFFHNDEFHEGHAHRFYYLEGALAAGFMPWTLLAPAAVLEYLRRPLRNDRVRYLVIWCLVVLVFYSFPRSKRGAYLLAMYPALAMLFGVALSTAPSAATVVSRWITASSKSAGVIFLAAAAAGIGGLAALMVAPGRITDLMGAIGWTVAGLTPALESHAIRYGPVALVMLLMTGAVGAVMIIGRSSGPRLVMGIAVAVAGLVVAINLVVTPALAATLTLRGFADALSTTVGSSSVAYLGGINYDIAFYTGRDIPVVEPGVRNEAQYVICARSVYDGMPPGARAHFVVALQSDPTELDGSGVIVLLKRLAAGTADQPATKAQPASSP